ncbi:helix-turn-helix domain-containing protein [Herbiconiux sp. VKM Ac-1786]|jgi:transcriptional regulator with XRE-family HTH domain|uniref:helix-turn-helix domain-containing protein n=1 Tax=Herbiconiux sp. VKM Ac-1786 TaxID=2783824 RepID=UPI00188B13CC|nr:XRE family transcriptional regulator [Herbiconiux sp. VKM Ac-1786]MBF4573363.1 helix-turn-helix domain-containing protein [Herbiconiux sp. VKM Ac-1786]
MNDGGGVERSTRPLDDDAVAMGARIRALRHEAGLTMVRLAAATGVSQPFLSLVERGHARPGLATLARLAEALGVPSGSLLARPAASRVTAAGVDVVHVEAEGRASAGHPGELTVWQLAQLPGGLFATEIVGEAAGDGGQRFAEFADHDEEEFLYLLAGVLEVELGDGTVHRLSAGDTLALGAGVRHRWRADGPEGFRAVTVTSGRHSH